MMWQKAKHTAKLLVDPVTLTMKCVCPNLNRDTQHTFLPVIVEKALVLYNNDFVCPSKP